jgi:hypothetical protein
VTLLEARVNLMAQEIHAFQEVGAVPAAALPGVGMAAAHPNGGMLNPAILAGAIGQFKSASTLLAPGEIPAPRVGQSSAVAQLASDPARDKSPGMQIVLAPSRPP